MKPIVIKGWIAKDSATDRNYETHYFSEEPSKYYLANPLGKFMWSGTIQHLPDKFKLKKGECKKVEITIKEIK